MDAHFSKALYGMHTGLIKRPSLPRVGIELGKFSPPLPSFSKGRPAVAFALYCKGMKISAAPLDDVAWSRTESS